MKIYYCTKIDLFIFTEVASIILRCRNRKFYIIADIVEITCCEAPLSEILAEHTAEFLDSVTGERHQLICSVRL